MGGIVLVGICMLISQFDPNLQRILDGNFQSGQDLYQLLAIVDMLYLGLIVVTYLVNRTLLNRGVNVD